MKDPRSRRSTFAFLHLVFLITLVVSLSGCGGCGRGYSEGDRMGVVTKLSYKGHWWKSWEGELNIGGNSGGSVPTTWKFTVVDAKVVPLVQAAAASGKPVMLHYIEWTESPVEMDTNYEAITVTVMP